MTSINFFPDPSALTEWLPLIDAVAKATIILGAAGLVSVLLRRASAALKHLVWTAALVAVLLLPALTMSLPRWEMPVFRFSTAPAPAVSGVDDASQHRAAALQVRIGDRAEATPSESTPASAVLTASSFSWRAGVVFLWGIGAALVLARLIIGFLVVQVMSRRTTAVEEARWLPLARELARTLGVSHITFRQGGYAAMPMAFGVWRPTVLMPESADDWPQDRLRIVLLHELAHVKRRDCLTHMLAQLACALYWFNPLAWIAARRVRAERERACDDLVLAAGTPGADYADQLLEVARVMRAGRFPALAAGASLAMAHRSQLEGRLMAILDPSVPRTGVSRVRMFAAACVAGVALIPLASLQAWTHTESTVPPPAAEQHAAQAPQSQPVPQPQMKQSTEAQIAAKQGAVQGAVQGAYQGAIQGAMQGVIQGAIQGVAQGVHQGKLQDAIVPEIPDAVQSTAERARPESQETGAKPNAKLIAALKAALQDSDKEVREAAMHALVQMRDPSMIEPLVQALKDAAPDVRQQAAFGLGQMRDKRAIEPLIGALKDSDAEVREQAAFALGQIRDRAAVDGLAAAIRDANADVREQVIFALGQIRDSRAVEPLVSALKDTAANVREQAAFALGQIRASGAVEALVVALKDNDPDVREQAAFALGQIRDPRAIDGLTIALKDPNASVRQQAAFALGQLAR